MQHGGAQARENWQKHRGELPMDIRLHLLETFSARGSDGAAYKVCAYERLAPDLSAPAGADAWESTGVIEYRLQDGRLVHGARDGTLRIVGGEVTLEAADGRARGGAAAVASA
jgi:hypothetical protein